GRQAGKGPDEGGRVLEPTDDPLEGAIAKRGAGRLQSVSGKLPSLGKAIRRDRRRGLDLVERLPEWPRAAGEGAEQAVLRTTNPPHRLDRFGEGEHDRWSARGA